MTTSPTNAEGKKMENDLKEALAEGLDLCVRAKKLDARQLEADMQAMGKLPDEGCRTRCATPYLWEIDQYDKDLAAWEQKSRNLLTRL